MDQNPIYRQKSMERIQSPEQLDHYLRVTNPVVWAILAAVILMLAGMLLWSSVASVESYVTGSAYVENGEMDIWFEDNQLSRNVEAGMFASIGEEEVLITSVGSTEDGQIFALADTDLADGIYSARITYRNTQIMRLVFR